MAKFQTIAVFAALSTFSASATIIDGSFPDTLTFASVTVPFNPTGAIVQPIVSQQNYDQTFTFTVAGATGTGLLFMQINLSAQQYRGSDFGNEGFGSCSNLSMLPDYPDIQTMPTGPGGCNPAAGNFGFAITFGQPLVLRFVAESFAAYSFSSTNTGLIPSLPAGYQIDSSVKIDGMFVLDSQLLHVPDAVVTVTDPPSSSVPEPTTAWVAFSALAALLAAKRSANHRAADRVTNKPPAPE